MQALKRIKKIIAISLAVEVKEPTCDDMTELAQNSLDRTYQFSAPYC